MEPFTLDEQIAAVIAMITDMRGKLLQATIVERVLIRKKLSNGKLGTSDLNAEGQNNANIASLKSSIAQLLDIHGELLKDKAKGE